MNPMMKSIKHTIQGIYLYVLLIAITLYIFTLFGLVFFIDTLPDDTRENFNSFEDSAFTAFKIMVGDNWNEMMYQTVINSTQWSSLYFVLLVMISQFIVINLLLAIIITVFNSSRQINLKMKAARRIEHQLEKGKTFKRAIELVLGEDFYK